MNQENTNALEPTFGPRCDRTQSKTFGVRRTDELESPLGNAITIERLGKCCAVLCCVAVRDEPTELKALRILKYPDTYMNN